MIIAVSLWLMAFISTCFAIPLVIYSKRDWYFPKGGIGNSLLGGVSTSGVIFAIATVIVTCYVYISPLIPEIIFPTIMVIP